MALDVPVACMFRSAACSGPLHVGTHLNLFGPSVPLWSCSVDVRQSAVVLSDGAPTTQAAIGVDPHLALPLRKAAKSPLHQELVARRIADLRSRIAVGGLREAVIRALLFGGMARAAVDERGFEIVRRLRRVHSDVSLAEFKASVREQFYMLLIDTEAALAAIPAMLPDDPELRRKALALIEEVLSVRGERTAEDERRIARVSRLFDADAPVIAAQSLAPAANENPAQAIAS
jgi:hypothetical protein